MARLAQSLERSCGGRHVGLGSFTSLPVRAKIDVYPLLPQERPKMVRRGERNNATLGHPGSPLIGLHRL
jgi:hypothetical protein